MQQLREVILAIESFKNDIKNHPIFFSLEDLNYLESDDALQNISEKLKEENYRPKFPSSYEIPYDLVSTRISHSLSIDDLIIRYVVINKLQKEIKLYSNSIDPSNYKVYCVVDIYDCYNHIVKKNFQKVIKEEFSNKLDSYFLDLIERCLDFESNSLNKIEGLIIGSKPDEYLAEIFLSIIHSKLNMQVSEHISRNGDEFLIGANSVGELRKITIQLIEFLKSFNLQINKSKNLVGHLEEMRQISRIIPYDEPWPYQSILSSPTKSKNTV